MATNSRLFGLLLAIFLFPGLSSVYAQNAGYFIETEGGEPRFIQRLAWSGGEYALRYEVVIENSVYGTYRNYRREFTQELHIDISLPPGSYRFRVIPYDILNRPGAASEWKYIEVLPALRPEPFAAIPEYITGGGGEPSGFLLNITGDNLDPNAEIFIRRADGTRIAAKTLDSGRGRNIRVFIESGILIPGEYEVVIRNPGGLEASIGGVPLLLPESAATAESKDKNISGEESERETAFDPLKPIIVSAGFAFKPSFPVYGDYVNGGASVYGFTVWANFLFYIPIGFYIGPELSTLFFLANYPDFYEEYDMKYSNPENDNFTWMVEINLLVRKWFYGERAALSFRAGVGYGILPNWINQTEIKMDISLLLRLTNNISLEGGIDYSHLLSDISGGFFRPWLGLGFQY